MEARPIHIRLQLETPASLSLSAEEDEMYVIECPELRVQTGGSGKHSSKVYSKLLERLLCVYVSLLTDCLGRHELIRQAAVIQETRVMMSKHDDIESLQDDMANLSRTLTDLRSEVITESACNKNDQLQIRQQLERTNKALDILTRITTNDRETFQKRVSAAKDVEGHTAVDKATVGLQTGHDESGAAIDE